MYKCTWKHHRYLLQIIVLYVTTFHFVCFDSLGVVYHVSRSISLSTCRMWSSRVSQLLLIVDPASLRQQEHVRVKYDTKENREKNWCHHRSTKDILDNPSSKQTANRKTMIQNKRQNIKGLKHLSFLHPETNSQISLWKSLVFWNVSMKHLPPMCTSWPPSKTNRGSVLLRACKNTRVVWCQIKQFCII